ncbi:PRC-barrel domain-containing protein [Pleomorphomonas diazotrophica]|uniref:PRC-barrel domain-containing protein n=1 Tax=Pleomorphomonas diazotrophica TaxID=1166257 RepID=UPI0008F0A9EF|nr:PRC-barrel domain-containing protein [Pleomorphomonas diazotrophica]SFM97473.1 PRC-barrel domain-containing protein [Pleomorphomonas diazotrophica]
MLWNASRIKGYAVAASDGDIGSVSDLLFDDQSWQIRWLVVDAGTWLTERKVLLPTSALGHVDAQTERFSVKMTRQQVKDSPDIDTERPVSRQSESDIYGYYGLDPYWGGGLYAAGYGSGLTAPLLTPSPETQRAHREAVEAQRGDDDPNLRSINEVEGYCIQATDGDIGHVEDMLVEEADWSIHYLVIDTRNWWPGKKVLISPHSAETINWPDKTVFLNVDRDRVKNSPEYDESTIVDRAYESRFDNYYNDSDPRMRRHG